MRLSRLDTAQPNEISDGEYAARRTLGGQGSRQVVFDPGNGELWVRPGNGTFDESVGRVAPFV